MAEQQRSKYPSSGVSFGRKSNRSDLQLLQRSAIALDLRESQAAAMPFAAAAPQQLTFFTVSMDHAKGMDGNI